MLINASKMPSARKIQKVKNHNKIVIKGTENVCFRKCKGYYQTKESKLRFRIPVPSYVNAEVDIDDEK